MFLGCPWVDGKQSIPPLRRYDVEPRRFCGLYHPLFHQSFRQVHLGMVLGAVLTVVPGRLVRSQLALVSASDPAPPALNVATPYRQRWVHVACRGRAPFAWSQARSSEANDVGPPRWLPSA